MAFPFASGNGFESGAHGFTSETDSTAILDFPHYTELARHNMAPYRGAYCMRIKPAGGTTSAYVQEDTAYDMALDDERYLRFYCYLGRDFTMAASDKVSLVEFESTLDTTTEVAAGLTNAAGVIQFWVNETAAAASAATFNLGNLNPAGQPGSALGRWYCFELAIVLDAGGGNDGSITGYVDGAAMTAKSSLDQAAIVNVKFGVIGLDAGTTGTILMDEIVFDDARVYPHKERFPQVFQVTKNEHIFVGPGWVESAAILSTTSTDTMILWDTDRADVLDTQGMKVELNNTIHSSASGPIYFDKGCYAVISGSSPRGQVATAVSSDRPGVFGPLGYSERGMIQIGRSKG